MEAYRNPRHFPSHSTAAGGHCHFCHGYAAHHPPSRNIMPPLQSGYKSSATSLCAPANSLMKSHQHPSSFSGPSSMIPPPPVLDQHHLAPPPETGVAKEKGDGDKILGGKAIEGRGKGGAYPGLRMEASMRDLSSRSKV
ncbi:hypothetical protein L7F22_033057 [Adiantum nelumboides]|nr:hypothetical protein [Adiantum nelumboides]